MEQACGKCHEWFAMKHDGEGRGDVDGPQSPYVFPVHQRKNIRAGHDLGWEPCPGSGRNEYTSTHAW